MNKRQSVVITPMYLWLGSSSQTILQTHCRNLEKDWFQRWICGSVPIFKKSKFGICFIVLYVDDNLIIGHPKAVDDTIDQLSKNNLMLKVEDNLHNYLSCEIVLSDNHTKA